VADRRGRLSLQAPARGDVQLELDQVQSRGQLGDRVLDLQPRVDLHEREATLGGLVQELDRAGIAIAGAQDQAARRLHDLALLLARQRGAGGLLDDLLVAALVGAVAQPDRPRAALSVGDDLHLDVARRGHQLLQQHGRVAEGLQRLGLRAVEGGRKRVGRIDAADAAPAAARGGLDHQREADPRGVTQPLVGGPHRTAAPRRHRDVRLLGEPLGGDLVAHQAHDLRVGADEYHPQPLAQLGELRVLGHEAPSDPRGVGAGLAQRALQRGVVQVAAAACAVRRLDDARPDAHRLVGGADEHRVALGLRVERDEGYRLAAPGVELAHRVDEPHRGLAAVHDRQTREGTLHRGRPQPLPIALRIGPSASASTPPGSSMVW
jgi:hypothetical protein